MEQTEPNFKEVSFAVPIGHFESLERRVKTLELARTDVDRKVDGLKKVCKLQQEFF